MTDERLKTFDGTLEGAAALDPERRDGIDWPAVQANITALEMHLQTSRQAFEQYENHAAQLEEAFLKLAEGDPVREQALAQWEKVKAVVASMRADLDDTEATVQALLHIPLTQETMHLPPERLQ